MDAFSYCDISSVFLTKTIDKIVSPMAVQLCHLIISLECNGTKLTKKNVDFEHTAKDLSKAMEHFAYTATRLGEECDDGILKKELDLASKSMLIFGKNVLLATQKLNIQPNFQKHQEDLIISAQNVLLGTLKILQLEDDAAVRKIFQATDWLLDCLTFLQAAENMSNLLISFREFAEAMLLVNTLTERRILELKHSLHQEHLSQTLQNLKKCVPMLYTAIQSDMMHPQNDQILASKWYIFDLAAKTVEELRLILTNGTIKQEQLKTEGTFSQQMCHLLEILTNPKPTRLHNSDLDFLAGGIVFYSMFVADCSRPAIKLRLVQHCQQLLELRKDISDQLNDCLPEGPCQRTMQHKLEQISNKMKAEMVNLNQTLVSAIFYQFLDAFTGSHDTLKRLLKSIMKNNKKSGFHSQSLFGSKALPILLQSFQNHTEKLLKVAGLVLAKCPHDSIIKEIQNSTNALCTVRDAVIGFVLDNKVHYETKFFEKAQSIYQRWTQATESLLASLDGIVTVHEFLDLCIHEIEDKIRGCEKSFRKNEVEAFHKQADDICSLTKHVVQFTNRYIDQSKDPVFRNGLRVFVRQLEFSLLETKKSINKCTEELLCVKAHKVFLDKMKHLLDNIYKVQEGVSGYKHPDLLSPLRTEVHPVAEKRKSIAFSEAEDLQEEIEKTDNEYNDYLPPLESYLSKPLPIRAPSKHANNLDSINKIPLSLQPETNKLILAIKTNDLEKISKYCSSLNEIANSYIELAKVSVPFVDPVASKTLAKYKDIEHLIPYFAQFNQEVTTKGNLSMDKLIQTAIFVSHNLEEIKNCLIASAYYWYTFSYQSFCSSAKAGIPCNMEIFNRTMQSLASIVQLVNQNSGRSDDKMGAVSGKHEHLAKIQILMTKAQIRANQLLCKAGFDSFLSDKSNLEHSCLQWSLTVQHLLKHIDDFMQFDSLFMSEPIALTKKNIASSKSFVQLCETSLWLQEAAALCFPLCMEGSLENNIGFLKEDLGSLRESILKIRDDLNSSTNPASSLLVDYALIQRQLILKMKLLVYHLRNNFKKKCGLVQSLVDFVVPAPIKQGNEDKVIAVKFAKDSCLLVENMKLVKNALHTKSEESMFLVEHLTFLTYDVVTKAGELLEHHQQWESFRLEVMSLNWTAKVQQLILHLQSNAQIDPTTVTFIRQCLQINSDPEFLINGKLISLENEKQNGVSLTSANTDVLTQPAVLEENENASRDKNHNINWELINTLYEETTVCGKTNDYIESIIDEKNATLGAGQKKVKGTQHEAKEQHLIQGGSKMLYEKETELKGMKVQQDNENVKPFQAPSSQNKQTIINKETNNAFPENYFEEGQKYEADKEQDVASQNISVVVDGEQQYSANEKLIVVPKQCEHAVDNEMMEASLCSEQPINIPVLSASQKLHGTIASGIIPEGSDAKPLAEFHETKKTIAASLAPKNWKANDIKTESGNGKPHVTCSEPLKSTAVLAPKTWQANDIKTESGNGKPHVTCSEPLKSTAVLAPKTWQANDIKTESENGKPHVACSEPLKSTAVLAPRKWQRSTSNKILPETDNKKLQPKCNEQKINMTASAAAQKVENRKLSEPGTGQKIKFSATIKPKQINFTLHPAFQLRGMLRRANRSPVTDDAETWEEHRSAHCCC
uniref:Uncharacterized LOC116410963 n=1 Tax=Xenopus tropicalis TaxID=8364 RepID=A0A803J3Q5_XENTR